MFKRVIASLAILVGLLAAPALGYGPKGHSMVGAIADQRLAGKPTAAKIADLIDGLTLFEAATLPDEIKSWDKRDFDDPDAFHLPNHPDIEKQLQDFVRANPFKNQPPGKVTHHSFHFTDVPVEGGLKYADGKAGRSEFDLVHMIPFCIDVLRGDRPADNDRKITQPVAVILLAHYLGDLHQPLHVGAEYFDDAGQVVDPDKVGGAADNGGNSLTLVLNRSSDHGSSHTFGNLHGYWDDETVVGAFGLIKGEMRKQRKGGTGQIDTADMARFLAVTTPKGWQPPAGLAVKEWSVAWADEILPIAREAHRRLEFSQIKVHNAGGQRIARGVASETPQPDRIGYHDWASAMVRVELHKAGWRLAALLEEVVK